MQNALEHKRSATDMRKLTYSIQYVSFHHTHMIANYNQSENILELAQNNGVELENNDQKFNISQVSKTQTYDI